MNLPHLAQIRLHPIKSLDGVTVTESRVGPAGGLELDRVWALHSAEGDIINGKNNSAVHRIRAAFAPDLRSVTLSAPTDVRRIAPKTFAFPDDPLFAADWFAEYFKQPVTVRYDAGGFPDDTIRNGPMIVSKLSLEAVCTWFPQISLEEARRRFRTPLEIDGVEAFWEDRLYREYETDTVRFSIGDVTMEGINPCPRCVVTARDSASGANLRGFQQRFNAQRRAAFPSWAAKSNRIKHFYHLGINTAVAATEHGKILRVGDAVNVK